MVNGCLLARGVYIVLKKNNMEKGTNSGRCPFFVQKIARTCLKIIPGWGVLFEQ